MPQRSTGLVVLWPQVTMTVVVEFFLNTDLHSERVVGKMKGRAGSGVEVAMGATFMREREG